MKTPEEWRTTPPIKLPWQHKHAIDKTNQYLYTDNEINAIQKDALEQGMIDAWKILAYKYNLPTNSINHITKSVELYLQAIKSLKTYVKTNHQDQAL